MKYSTAVTLVKKINEFRETLKSIDIDKADKKRGGGYTIALKQLNSILDNDMELDEITKPDNMLRNIMMLSHLDKNDCKK